MANLNLHNAGLLKATEFGIKAQDGKVILRFDKTQIPLTISQAGQIAQRMRVHARRAWVRNETIAFVMGNVRWEMEPNVGLWMWPQIVKHQQIARSQVPNMGMTIGFYGILSDGENDYKHGYDKTSGPLLLEEL